MILVENNLQVSSDKRRAYVLLSHNKDSLVVEINSETAEVVFARVLDKSNTISQKDMMATIDKVEIISYAQSFTLVPREFNFKENKKAITEFNFATNSNLEVYEDVSPDSKIDIVFQEKVDQLIDISKFPIFEVNHLVGRFISFVSRQVEDNLLLVILNETLFVTLQLNGQIQLANAFTVKNTEEVLYYTMLIIQEFQIDPTTIHIYHAGDFEKIGTLNKELTLYFLNITGLNKHGVEDVRFSGLIKILTS